MTNEMTNAERSIENQIFHGRFLRSYIACTALNLDMKYKKIALLYNLQPWDKVYGIKYYFLVFSFKSSNLSMKKQEQEFRFKNM